MKNILFILAILFTFTAYSQESETDRVLRELNEAVEQGRQAAKPVYKETPEFDAFAESATNLFNKATSAFSEPVAEIGRIPVGVYNDKLSEKENIILCNINVECTIKKEDGIIKSVIGVYSSAVTNDQIDEYIIPDLEERCGISIRGIWANQGNHWQLAAEDNEVRVTLKRVANMYGMNEIAFIVEAL